MTPELEKELAKIYVGQNVRINARFGVKKGILSSDVDSKLAKELQLMGLIKEEYFYDLQLYVTTPDADSIIKPQLKAACRLFDISQYRGIPRRIIAFVVRRYLSRGLNFPVEQPISETEAFENAADRLLMNREVWNFCTEFIRILEEKNLCVKTRYFVSSRGGERKEPCYVVSQEFQDCLKQMPIPIDFSEKEEKELCIYEVLVCIGRHFEEQASLLEFGLKEYFKLLEERDILEECIKPIIDKASLLGLTSKYEQLPNTKPFVIYDLHRFQAYLYRELIKPKIELLLENGTEEFE